MVSRIATANYYSTVLSDLMAAQNRQVDAQNQVSTGKVSTDLKGFAEQARTLVSTQSVKARVDGLVDQLNNLTVKLNIQQTSLQAVSDTSQSLRETIGNALASGRGDGLMDSIRSMFSQTVEALNTRYGNGYLFSGGQLDTAPVSVNTLDQLAAAPDTASVFHNGDLKAVSRIDDTTTTQTGFLASDVGQGLMDVFRTIQQFQNSTDGNFGGQLTDAQKTFLEQQMSTLTGVTADAVDVTAQGGSVQKRVEDAQSAQTDRQTTLTNLLGDITDVDMADAVSKLTQAQTAVQASAQVFMSLKDMSLLNYLK